MLSHSVMSDSLCPHGLWPTRLFCPWDSPGKNTGVCCHFLLQGIFSTQGSNLSLPHCRQIFLPFEPPGKPKNTGVGSLSLLQQIFLTQELKWGLLHCRWILYQLSSQGSPIYSKDKFKSTEFGWRDVWIWALIFLMISCVTLGKL